MGANRQLLEAKLAAAEPVGSHASRPPEDPFAEWPEIFAIPPVSCREGYSCLVPALGLLAATTVTALREFAPIKPDGLRP